MASTQREDLVVLYKRAPAWGLPSVCTGSLAVEAYLRLAGIPFACEPCPTTSASPSGELPAAEVGHDLLGDEASGPGGSGDSWASAKSILETLRRRYPDMDASLAPGDRGCSAAFAALIDSSLFPASEFFTWMDAGSYKRYTAAAYGGGLPFPVNHAVPWAQRRAVCARLRLSSTSDDQLIATAAAAYAAIAAQLTAAAPKGPYLFGNKPSTADALAFAHLFYQRNAPVCARLRAELCKHEVISEYVQMMHRTVFAAPAPAPPVDDRPAPGPGDSRTKPAEGARKKRTTKEERFRSRGKQWLGFAAAVVVGYVLLSGSYIDIDPEFFYEDDEDDM